MEKIEELLQKIIEQNKIIVTAKIALLKKNGLCAEASVLEKAAGDDYLFKLMLHPEI